MTIRRAQHCDLDPLISYTCHAASPCFLDHHPAFESQAEFNEERDGGIEVLNDDADVVQPDDSHTRSFGAWRKGERPPKAVRLNDGMGAPVGLREKRALVFMGVGIRSSSSTQGVRDACYYRGHRPGHIRFTRWPPSVRLLPLRGVHARPVRPHRRCSSPDSTVSAASGHDVTRPNSQLPASALPPQNRAFQAGPGTLGCRGAHVPLPGSTPSP